MQRITWIGERGSMNYLILFPLLLLTLGVIGMVFADQTRNRIGRMQSALLGQPFPGFGPTRLTPARMRLRNFKNFDDARIRQDQYNRKHEPMKSRK